MSNKRNFSDEGEEGNRRFKRICSYQPNGSPPVSVKMTLNQLLNSRPKNDINSGHNSDSVDKNCFNCLTKCQSIWISCNFCERNVCDDCSVNCFRCLYTFCRLCAVKSYEISHQNNSGVCLSCGS